MAETTYISKLRKQLEAVEAAISAILVNGQEHSLTGSHSFKGVEYSVLLRERKTLEAKIAAANGGSNVTIPDYS